MKTMQYYPMSQEQKAVVGAFESFPSQLLNLCVRIDIHSEIQEERMLEAIRLSCKRLPFMNFRCHKNEDGSLVQYQSDEEPQGLDRVEDLSFLSEKKAQKKLDGWASTPFPNHFMDVQLHRLKLCRLPEGKHCLFVCIHHAISDVYAIIFLMTYIDKVYKALEMNTELPPKGSDPIPMVERSLTYQASEKHQRDIKWWKDALSEEPHFTSIGGKNSKEFIKGKQYGHAQTLLQMRGYKIIKNIPADLVNKVEQHAEEVGVSPHLYYFLALRTYLGKMSETEDVMVNALLACRSSREERTAGLCRVNSFFFRTVVPDSMTFERALHKLKEQQFRVYRHVINMNTSEQAPILASIHQNPKKTKYYSVWFTYQPYINYRELYLDLSIKFMDADVAPAPLYLTVMPYNRAGDWMAAYQCALGYTEPESVEKFHQFMLKFLETGIEQPQKSVSELFEKCNGI